jgi:uncharacterized protein YdeI (BOF family)
MLALGLALAASSTAFASDKDKDAKDKKAAKPEIEKQKVQPAQAPHEEKNAEVTGSYIKRTIRRNGQITDGPYQVVVIDQKAIRDSGASDLRQLLNRQGAGH